MKQNLLSDVKVILMKLPSDVINGGNRTPQNSPCFLRTSSPSLLATSTESYSHSSWYKLLPSRSKCVKFRVIRYWGGAIISQTQFLFPGYASGNDGLVMVPLLSSKNPPHASVKKNIEYYYLDWNYLNELNKCSAFEIIIVSCLRNACRRNVIRNRFYKNIRIHRACWYNRARNRDPLTRIRRTLKHCQSHIVYNKLR